MNYIYDIYLNLNDVLYDFFDWNRNDKIIHIKKIPIFKICDEILKNIIYNYVNIDAEFLNIIHNKTEVWNFEKKLEFCALFCDNNNIIAIEFDNKGNSLKKSFLQIDEELEILETVNKLKERDLEFQIIKNDDTILKTRKQIKEENFINNELKDIDNDKLMYIYFECFGRHEKNRKEILKKFKNIKKNSKIYKNLYNILKLTSQTKNNMV